MSAASPAASVAAAREAWALGDYGAVAVSNLPVAAHLVRFAGVRPGEAVLDVATGTGNAALTARRAGARVVGLDSTPPLLAQAAKTAALLGLDAIEWREGDAEAMPFADASFDVVLSQFGHMFCPRPDAAVRELLRVVRPGGRVALATWPPEHLGGGLFALLDRFRGSSPAPPAVEAWGDPSVVRARLGDGVEDVAFERGVMTVPSYGPAHYRTVVENKLGPAVQVVRSLENDPARLADWRRALDALVGAHFADNTIRFDYLLTRAARR